MSVNEWSIPLSKSKGAHGIIKTERRAVTGKLTVGVCVEVYGKLKAVSIRLLVLITSKLSVGYVINRIRNSCPLAMRMVGWFVVPPLSALTHHIAIPLVPMLCHVEYKTTADIFHLCKDDEEEIGQRNPDWQCSRAIDTT
ncbi:hypothetical protein GQR58_008626 [Nymphon striatum]|nr:hypothetical protein GQR58_008626 [Nymphon striatum]